MELKSLIGLFFWFATLLLPCTLLSLLRLLHARQYCLQQDKEGVEDMNLKNSKQSIGGGLGTRGKITCRTFITKWRFASAHL